MPLDADGRHDLEAMAREVTAATRIVLVCNPNNPTATALPLAEIDAFVADLPRHVCVILDEAYVEFSTLQDPDESLELVDRHPNLVLLRTFSKVYGLCGLRVGYALGSEDFRLAVDRVRQPFSVNALAQAAAVEALRHQDEVERRVERTAIERLHVDEELRARGLATTESQANFAWVSLGDRDEAEVMRGLAERGRDRPGRRSAGRRGPHARHLRHAPGERPLPGGAGRGAGRAARGGLETAGEQGGGPLAPSSPWDRRRYVVQVGSRKCIAQARRSTLEAPPPASSRVPGIDLAI